MKNVFVTGGAGFIGSHVVDLLIKKDYKVTVIDNLSQGRKEWVNPKAEFIDGDITNIWLLNELCKGRDAVFHLAAMSRVLPSLTDSPAVSAHNNIMGTLNVLEAATKAGVSKVVYSASSTVYGNRPAPHHISDKPDLLNPYALTKYVGELYCDQFAKMFNLSTVCLRYFQVYGPRQPMHGEYATVVGIFLEQFKNKKPLTIQGNGSQLRDFVHVHDVAKANLLALEENWCGTWNVGTGTSHSIKELANLISPNQIFTEARKRDMKETLADKPAFQNMIDFKTGIQQLMGSS